MFYQEKESWGWGCAYTLVILFLHINETTEGSIIGRQTCKMGSNTVSVRAKFLPPTLLFKSHNSKRLQKRENMCTLYTKSQL